MTTYRALTRHAAKKETISRIYLAVYDSLPALRYELVVLMGA